MISHDRTSCSDVNPANGYNCKYGSKCRKCHLIEILNGEWGDGDFEADFEVHINQTGIY